MASPLELVSGIQQARDAGYTPDEIYGHLAQRPEFAAAKDSGYSFDEVYQHLYSGAVRQALNQTSTSYLHSVASVPEPAPQTTPTKLPQDDLKQFLTGSNGEPVGEDYGGAVSKATNKEMAVQLGKAMLTPGGGFASELGLPEGISSAHVGEVLFNHAQQYVAEPDRKYVRAMGKVMDLPGNLIADLVNFTLSPAGVAASAFGAAGVVPKKILGYVFAGQALKDTPGLIDEWKDADTPEKKVDVIQKAIGLGAMALGPVHEALRPSGELRSGGLSPDQANRAAAENELRTLAPQTAEVVAPKPKGVPLILDGLTTARRKAVDGFASATPEQQQVRQVMIDHIDDVLLNHDKDSVRESEARTAPRSDTTPPQAAPATAEVPGSPPVQGGSAGSFKQAQAEVAKEAPLTAEVLKPTPETPPEQVDPRVAYKRARASANERSGGMNFPDINISDFIKETGLSLDEGKKLVQQLHQKGEIQLASGNASTATPEKLAAGVPHPGSPVPALLMKFNEAESAPALGRVQVKGPQGDWLDAEVVSRDGKTLQLKVDDPIYGERTQFVDQGETRATPEESKPIPKPEPKSDSKEAVDHLAELTEDLRDARESGDEEGAASLERVIGALRKKAAGEPVTTTDVFGEKKEQYHDALQKEQGDDVEASEKGQTEREKLEEDLPQSLKDILYGREPTKPSGKMKRGGKQSGAIINPGEIVQKFYEDDAKPFVVKGAANTVEAMRQIKKFIAPANVDEYARSAAGIVRQNAAELARGHEIAAASLKKASKQFDKLSDAQNLQIIDAIETGGRQSTPELQQFADTMRDALDDRLKQVQSLGTGKLEQFIQNYFPHIWEDPKRATSVFGQIFGKRPLEGSKNFLKQRTIPTTADGIAQGLKPVSHNPVELTLMKLHEMDRYIMGQKIMEEMKAKGLTEFVPARSKAPDGTVKIDDRVAQVVQMRPTVRADGTIGAPEMVLRGHYYAPEGAARVLNNYLSPGLRGIKVFDAIRSTGNVLNQAQLGLSAFHLGFVSVDSGVSKVALGIENILSGKPIEGLKDIAQSPIAPIQNLIRGNKMLEEYYKPGSQGAEVAELMDASMKGGARATMDSFYKTDAWKGMMKAFRSGNVIGGVLRAPFAVLEKSMFPVLEYAVPRMKMGMFADLAKNELERIGPNATIEEKRAVMAKAWDSVDNRMGQLVYDNLFWHKAFKDSMMAAQRSVGWNLGTIREIGGGVADILSTPARALRESRGEARLGEKIVTHRMAYAMALPVVVGVLGAIYQKLHTGMLPGQNKDGTFGGDETALKDMFLPRTGQTNAQGEEERVQLPSYMKDVFAYSKHPVRTIANKASPPISMVSQMLNNKDYYGTQIINPDDPLYKKAADELKFVAKQFVPFSVQTSSKRVDKGAESKSEGFVGITTAPAELTRTPAHQEMMDNLMKRLPAGAKTKEEQDRYEMQKAIVDAGKHGTPLSQSIIDAHAKGEKFTPRQVANLRAAIQKDPRALMFSRLSLDEAKKVYSLGNTEEKKLFRPLLNAKKFKAGEPPEKLVAKKR